MSRSVAKVFTSLSVNLLVLFSFTLLSPASEYGPLSTFLLVCSTDIVYDEHEPTDAGSGDYSGSLHECSGSARSEVRPSLRPGLTPWPQEPGPLASS